MRRPFRLRSGRRETLRPNRVAADKGLLAEERSRRVVRHRRRPHPALQQTIGQTRHRVLLEQHRRHAAQRRDEYNRPRAVAADADHEIRLSARNDPPGIEQPGGDQRRATRARGQLLPLEAGAANHVERESFARNHPRFGPANEITTSGRRDCSSRATAIPGYRCPPVPPPAITTRSAMRLEAARAHTLTDAELSIRAGSAAAPDAACCDTFNRIPMPM